MRNYNWRTKLKTNKNFRKGIITKKKEIKRMRNKIEKNKNKKDNHALYPVEERKEWKKRNNHWR